MPHELLSRIGETIRSINPSGGGCIAESFSIETEKGSRYFAKRYFGKSAAKIAKAEVDGLNEIRQSAAIRAPLVLGVSGPSIVMEHISSGKKNGNFWEKFGRSLAAMHRQTSGEGHGFVADNYIGSTPQQNLPRSFKWSEFYTGSRLLPQFSLMSSNGFVDTRFSGRFEKLLKRIPELVDDNSIQPSLLHGDLWSGNFLVSQEGEAVLIDPAVYYGDRETDLAMTRLFGGFDERFYSAYNEVWALPPGNREREILYKLYHQMNHLNLFGAGYLGSVKAGVEKLT